MSILKTDESYTRETLDTSTDLGISLLNKLVGMHQELPPVEIRR